MKRSENLNLKLPEGDDPLEITDLSENFEALDGAVGEAIKNAAPYKVGDTLTTWRTDLGENWLLCNGDEFDPKEYPELARCSDFPVEYLLNRQRPIYTTAGIHYDYQYGIISYIHPPAGNRLVFFTVNIRTASSNYVVLTAIYDFAKKEYVLKNPTDIAAILNNYNYIANKWSPRYVEDPGVFVYSTGGSSFAILPEVDIKDLKTSEIKISRTNSNSTLYFLEAVNSLGRLCLFSISGNQGAFVLDRCDFDGSNYSVESHLMQAHAPSGWSTDNSVICSVADNGKFVMFLRNTYYVSARDVVANDKHFAFAVTLIDPESPETVHEIKKIYIRSDVSTTFSNSGSINTENLSIKYVGDGEHLVSFTCVINKVTTYRNLPFRSFDEFPDETILDFTSGKTTYGINIANSAGSDSAWAPHYIIKYKNKYLFNGKQSELANGSIAFAVNAVDNPNETGQADTIPAFVQSVPASTTRGVQSMIPKRKGGAICLLVLNNWMERANETYYTFMEMPYSSVPYITKDLYTYIKAKEDSTDADQQTDTPAS